MVLPLGRAATPNRIVAHACRGAGSSPGGGRATLEAPTKTMLEIDTQPPPYADASTDDTCGAVGRSER